MISPPRLGSVPRRSRLRLSRKVSEKTQTIISPAALRESFYGIVISVN